MRHPVTAIAAAFTAASYGRNARASVVRAASRPAEAALAKRCDRRGTSAGFRASSAIHALASGSARIAIAASVQAHS